MNKLDSPLNSEERYMHGINIRLNILIEMMSSFLEVYAKENEVPTTEEVYEEVEVEEEIELNEPDEFDYNTLTKAEIIKDLEIHGVYYTSNMLKSELIEQAKKYL